MIKPKEFYDTLGKYGVDFFVGVPDSLLKDFCSYVDETAKHHIIAANEGNAIALATGHYLATGNLSLVYMQNSGLGNCVNPLTSLTDPEVYGIPMLLLIGWRAEPGVKDEPQHVKQGKITLETLETLGIPYSVLPVSIDEAKTSLEQGIETAKKKGSPFAFVVKRGSFEKYGNSDVEPEFTREQVIKKIVDNLNENDIVVSTTGKASRELFEYREKLGQNHSKDFLTVGSMGHASQIALGIALSKPNKQVYCLDGDGAVIMHMGTLATIGTQDVKNLKHIVLNNQSHESVGGQPTARINISKVARACGYKYVFEADKFSNLEEKIKLLKEAKGPAMLEVKMDKGSREDLGRPTTTPKENKEAFMKFLQE